MEGIAVTATAVPGTGEGPGEAPPHALIERRGHVLIVTLNRPEARNALSAPMMALMRQAWDIVDGDPGIRVCVLTGAGRSAPVRT
jgi:enoyl-CoA hydratase